MPINLYTRAILTISAVLLAVVALKPLLEPQPVIAQGKFSGVQITANAGGGLWLFDGKTGDAWLGTGN